ncbi:hypothetical protein OURE66S_00528 [Oligella ureolytica]
MRDARPLMMAFAEKYEVSVSLAVEDGGEMLYLESIRSPARLAVQLTVGSTVPLSWIQRLVVPTTAPWMKSNKRF